MLNDKRFVKTISVQPPSESKGYPFSIPSIANFGEVSPHEKVTYIVGENGSGKSTLIEALAVACRFNPEGGNRNTRFTTLDTVSPLHKYLRVGMGKRIDEGFFFRSETMYNLFSKAEQEKDDPFGWHVHGWAGRHEASHGEGHLALIRDKIRPGFLIFDEPEAALSPASQLSFLALIHGLIAEGSQIVIATHSPIILSYPDSDIYSLTENGPEAITYDDASCVQMYRLFMNQRDRVVNELLADSDN